MKKFLISSCFVFAFANTSSAAITTGSYHCTGYDPIEEIEYTGYATVHKVGAVYQMSWDFGKKMVYEGIALIHAEEDDILAVSFRNKSNPKKSGVKVYEIDGDELKGNWVMFGHKTVANELCKKVEE